MNVRNPAVDSEEEIQLSNLSCDKNIVPVLQRESLFVVWNIAGFRENNGYNIYTAT